MGADDPVLSLSPRCCFQKIPSFCKAFYASTLQNRNHPSFERLPLRSPRPSANSSYPRKCDVLSWRNCCSGHTARTGVSGRESLLTHLSARCMPSSNCCSRGQSVGDSRWTRCHPLVSPLFYGVLVVWRSAVGGSGRPQVRARLSWFFRSVRAARLCDFWMFVL